MILDIIIILGVIISVYLGYKKGLTQLAIKLVALILSILITFILYKPVSAFIINVTQIDETIENIVYEKAYNIMDKNQNEENTQNNNFYEEVLKKQLEQNMLPKTAKTISINLIQFSVLIGLFVISKIAIMCLKSLAKFLANLPLIKQFDKIGGIIYGLIRIILITYVFFAIVQIYANINSNNLINNQINQSYISKIIYENNIINKLI